MFDYFGNLHSSALMLLLTKKLKKGEEDFSLIVKLQMSKGRVLHFLYLNVNSLIMQVELNLLNQTDVSRVCLEFR